MPMLSRFSLSLAKVGMLLICFFIIAYVANYCITPRLVGVSNLKLQMRPRCNSQFDTIRWRDSNPTKGQRYAMVDDLMERRLLLGKTEAGVSELLGEPMARKQTGRETMLYYTLSSQDVYPARSWLFPGLFGTFDNWTFEILLSNNTCHRAVVGY